MSILKFMLVCFLVRLISLAKSIYNERRLKATGASEYGKVNSAALTIAHILFYISCVVEALYYKTTVNAWTYWGLGVFAFSMIMLWWVILSLGQVWTVKLIISTNHVLKTNFLFKYVRHPNYFLNIIPELVSVSLICNAWTTLIIGLPVYLIPLAIRIRQEEEIMKEKFPSY